MNPFIILAPSPPSGPAFWSDMSHWPQLIPPGYVFLAEATEQVGRALHGDDWTGDEMSAVAIPMLPTIPSMATMDQLAEASASIGEASGFRARREASRPRGLFGAKAPRPIFYPFVLHGDFTPEEWLLVIERRHAVVLATNAAIQRRITAQLEIARACLSGDLPFALRPPASGAMVEGQPARWNVDDQVWLAFFDRCEMSDDPGGAGDNLKIFVGEPQLNRLLRGLSATASTTIDGGTVGQESRVRAYLAELMRANPSSPIPNTQLRAMCAERFGHIGTRLFDRAKGNAVTDARAPAWSKAGRRGAAGQRTQ